MLNILVLDQNINLRQIEEVLLNTSAISNDGRWKAKRHIYSDYVRHR